MFRLLQRLVEHWWISYHIYDFFSHNQKEEFIYGADRNPST
jgi:hypothetical protein